MGGLVQKPKQKKSGWAEKLIRRAKAIDAEASGRNKKRKLPKYPKERR